MDLVITLGVAALVLIGVLGAGVLILIKLGVLTHYALKPERPEGELGDYQIEASRESGEGKE
jgi:hypothetical protein